MRPDEAGGKPYSGAGTTQSVTTDDRSGPRDSGDETSERRALGRDSRLYPNAGESADRSGGRVSRRSMLTAAVAAGATATAGCLGDDGDTGETVFRRTMFVFNTGDGTVSLVDVERNEVVDTVPVGLSSSFPSNQFTASVTDSPEEPLWLNVDQGVRALTAGSLSEGPSVETGSGANWQEQTPDGEHLVVSAREPAHRQFRIDASPDSETFGEVTAEIDRRPEGGRGDNSGPGPCDVSIHPDGEFAYVPDLFGDTLTVVDIEAFEVHRQVTVEARGRPPVPWMCTAAPDGETLLVEHNAGTSGAESIWDVGDPGEPVEQRRLTPEDGLGEGALTSEIGPDSAFGYVFTPDTEDVTVLDIEAGEVERRLGLGGAAFTGSWDPDYRTLYVPVRSSGEVAVVDPDSREITTTIEVGPEPYGVTGAGRRPADPSGAAASLDARLTGLTGSYETTYCIGECACGHEL
jgi:YVTN family beta-propeller protein